MPVPTLQMVQKKGEAFEASGMWMCETQLTRLVGKWGLGKGGQGTPPFGTLLAFWDLTLLQGFRGFPQRCNAALGT